MDRYGQKRPKMLVRVQKMDLYGHPRRKTALALLKPEIEAPLERSDFACRRTAASAAESLPRGEGLRPAVFPFYSPRKSEQVRFLSARAKG